MDTSNYPYNQLLIVKRALHGADVSADMPSVTDADLRRVLDVIVDVGHEAARAELLRDDAATVVLSQIAILEPPAEREALPWDIRTIADAKQPRPPVQYLVDGIIEAPSVNILYGPPGSLKSMVAADLAMAVATGQPWLSEGSAPDTTGIDTTRAGVLWLDCDNGQRRTDERIEAMATARRAGDDVPFYYVSMPSPAFQATDLGSVMMLIDHIRALRVRLVVIDNLGLVLGDAEENSAYMATVMGTFRLMAERTGAAFVIIHHQRKSNGSHGGRAGDTLRGHSSIEASLDLAMLVIRDPESSVITLVATKVRGADIRPVSAEFSYTHKDGTRELEMARFWASNRIDTESPIAIRAAITRALTDAELNQRRLIEAVKEEGITASDYKIRKIIKEMEHGEKLNTRGGADNAIFYSI